MYEASGTIYSSPAAAQFSSQQAPVQEYSTATVIYQPPIIQPFIQPQQYYVQQPMWSASFQQAQPAYYPQYTLQQQQAYQSPDQAQPVPLVNLARLVSSSSPAYSTGSGVMNVTPTSTSATITVPNSATRTKMAPTRLKNMGGGARTKAKMREMLEEQKRMELAKKQQQQAPKKKRVRKLKEKSTKEPNKATPKSNTAKEGIQLTHSIDDTISSVIFSASPPALPAAPAEAIQSQAGPSGTAAVTAVTPVPKKKGRPRKNPLPDPASVAKMPLNSSVPPLPPAATPVNTAIATPETKKPSSAKKAVKTEPQATATPETVAASPIVKRPRGRPSKSKEIQIRTEMVEIEPVLLEPAPKAPSPSPKKLAVGKRLSQSPAKSPKIEVVSPKEKKSKLSPGTAAVLKATASEKLKAAKVRVRAKVAKALKSKKEAEVQAQMTTAALKLKQRAIKAPRIRIRKPKVGSEVEGPKAPKVKRPRKSRALARPTEESMNETIDYVVGLVNETYETKPTQEELALVQFPIEIPSTSAAARLALAEANLKTATPCAGAKKQKVPTVFVKKSDLTVGKRLGKKERKEHGRKGPSLKVKREKVKFYRGGEEEEEPVIRVGLEKPRFEFDESVPWRCVFCNFKQFSFGLGDLFGPYYVDRLVGGQPKAKETWLHSGCSVWAPGVVLIGSTLHGLSEAVGQCERIECTICKKRGATIGCLQRGCGEVAHLPCAVMNKWSLNENNFKSRCPTHAEHVLQSPESSPRKAPKGKAPWIFVSKVQT